MRIFSVVRQIFVAFLLVSIENQVTARLNVEKSPIYNVAVIGAGVSGLLSTKHCIEKGFNVTVYEQTDHVGGIWKFTDKTGKDKYGINIHSPMYQGLRTNAPYNIMEIPGHHFPEGTPAFPSHYQVHKYIQSYADRFGLNEYIKFNHLVIRVLPIENGKWEIIVKDLPNDTFITQIYDAVFVANGHFSKPRYPNIPGIDEFNGTLMHSHDYRRAEKYFGENVLIIGAGSSSIDLVNQLSKVASQVTVSQHKRPNESKEAREKRTKALPANVVLQDDVKRFTATGAEFIDGTEQSFTVIICATGYEFSYPFLSVESGIHVDDNWVQPLYKQIFNIEHPTMIFTGIPYSGSLGSVYDLQVRFAMKYLTGEKKLPSKSEMISDMREQTQIQWHKGYNKHNTHNLGSQEKDYYKELAETANIKSIPDVVPAAHFESILTQSREPNDYRKYKYTFIDDKTYTKEKYED